MRSFVDVASAVLERDFWKEARTVRELGMEGMQIDDLLEWLKTRKQ
jgi:hypothetical protein